MWQTTVISHCLTCSFPLMGIPWNGEKHQRETRTVKTHYFNYKKLGPPVRLWMTTSWWTTAVCSANSSLTQLHPYLLYNDYSHTHQFCGVLLNVSHQSPLQCNSLLYLALGFTLVFVCQMLVHSEYGAESMQLEFIGTLPNPTSGLMLHLTSYM